MSFYSENFMFNDISNVDMDVILVSMDSGILMDYGINFKDELQVEMSSKSKFYYSQESEVEPITITLALVDRQHNPKPWTVKDRMRVLDWIVTDKFMPFVSEDDDDLIYYMKCIGYTRKFNARGEGVIEFTMQPESQYAYSPIIKHNYTIKGEKEFSIRCMDNVNEKNYPKMEIIQFDKDKNKIEIHNLTLNKEPFIINNLTENEKVEIDHMLKSINSNIELYKLKDVNRKWIHLTRGVNKIKVVGNCQISIFVQFPIKV